MKALCVNLMLLVTVAGCALFTPRKPAHPAPSTYHAANFAPGSVSRMLLLPLVNESPYPLAADQVQTALAAELQALGGFEVVVAPSSPELLCVAQIVRQSGRFDEAGMLDLARSAHAEGILIGTVTQYHPYGTPRLGLTLQLVAPAEAVVVASVDGLWDARDPKVAKAVTTYYRQRCNLFQPAPEGDLALTSPQLYQRFVCHAAATALMRPASAVGEAPEELPQPISLTNGKSQSE